MAELTQVLCKGKRKWGSSLMSGIPIKEERTHIIEEIADCKIMLEQLEYLLSTKQEVAVEIENKLDMQAVAED